MNLIWSWSKIWVKHSDQFRLSWLGSFGRISSKVLLENLDFCLTDLTYGYVPENYAYLFGNRVPAAGE